MGHSDSRFVEELLRRIGGRQADPNRLDLEYASLVQEAGADLLLHAWAAEASTDGNRVTGARLATKQRLCLVEAAVTVDATGDGDVAYSAGAAFEQGRPGDGTVQPVSIMYRIAGVDETAALVCGSEEEARRIRLSAWPVRGGLAWHDGRIYAAAGIFPEQGGFLTALDAETGVPAWTQRSPNVINGPLLADGDTLWTPTHRTTPCLYRLSDGRPQLDPLPVLLGRGAAQIWKLDNYVAWGPDEGGLIYLQLTAETAGPGAKMKRGGQSPLGVVSVLHAWCALASPTRLAAMETGAEPPADMAGYGKLMSSIAAPDRLLGERLEKSAAWTIAIPEDAEFRAALIAGKSLILGGRNEVRAFDLRSGEERWRGAAEGQVWGLAAADRVLCIGTDAGVVQAFRGSPGAVREWPTVRAEPKDAAFSEAANGPWNIVVGRGVCVWSPAGEQALWPRPSPGSRTIAW